MPTTKTGIAEHEAGQPVDVASQVYGENSSAQGLPGIGSGSPACCRRRARCCGHAAMRDALLPCAMTSVRPTNRRDAGVAAHAAGTRTGGGASPPTTGVVAPMTTDPRLRRASKRSPTGRLPTSARRRERHEQGHVRRCCSNEGQGWRAAPTTAAASATDGEARPSTVRVARWSAEHPWRAIAAWVIFVTAVRRRRRDGRQQDDRGRQQPAYRLRPGRPHRHQRRVHGRRRGEHPHHRPIRRPGPGDRAGRGSRGHDQAEGPRPGRDGRTPR